jgi:hypothetical protein
VNHRAVSRREVLGWACRGIAALLAAGCALGLTASGAAADQVPVILQYSCQLPIVGGTPLTATFVWPSALQTATAGTRTPSLPVEVQGTVGSAARTVVSFAAIKWIEGTVDVSAEVTAPQGDIGENVQLAVPRTDVSTGSGPLTVPASGLIPSVLLSQAGQAKVVVGAVVIHLATLTASGSLSILGNLSLSCTLDPSQTGVVSSLQILPAASSAARSSPAAQAAPRPAPTTTPTTSPTLAPIPTRARARTPAPGSSLTLQTASAGLLRHAAPLARSFPGFLLLALFLLCAAVLVILKTTLRIFTIGLAAAIRNPAAKRSPPKHASPHTSA